MVVRFNLVTGRKENMRRYRILELGRSMVEMLGVLAIIGLLSIIGIQGYKKAMNRAKANELMDLAMKLHHENLAYAVTQRKPETYPECKLFMRTTSDLTTTEKRRAEWEVPSWVDNPKFNIQVSYCASVKASSGSPYQRQTYYLMMFYHMNKSRAPWSPASSIRNSCACAWGMSAIPSWPPRFPAAAALSPPS